MLDDTREAVGRERIDAFTDRHISKPRIPRRSPSLRGDGGLFSTAPDYGKFLQMLLDGQRGGARPLKASTVAEMLKPHTNGVRVRPQPSANPLSSAVSARRRRGYLGLGFQLADLGLRASRVSRTIRL